MFERLRDGRTIRSVWGWPVPAVARIVTAEQFRELIGTAVSCGFSRRGRNAPVEPDLTYVLFPNLPEMSPSPSWICVVVAVPPGGARAGTGRKLGYGLIDVAVDDFRRLPRMRRRRRDELLNWLANGAHDRRA